MGTTVKCNNCDATAEIADPTPSVTFLHTEVFPGPIKPATLNALLYTDGPARGWSRYYNGATLCAEHTPTGAKNLLP